MSKDILKTYGKGAALMIKMGYVPGTGLGDKGQGIIEPIMPTLRKKGEGIKVDGKRQERNMMQSMIVDDWSESEEENNSEDEADGQVPLGFNKSGIYKSEYDVPDITELIRKLRDLKVEVPYELMEWIDSIGSKDLDSPRYLQLRKTFWDILKDAQADIPKVKFLSFEIKNIEEFSFKCERDLNVLMKVCEFLENYDINKELAASDDSIVNRILKIEGILETSNEVKTEIVSLFASTLEGWWSGIVEMSNFQDIDECGEILDIAVKFMGISKSLEFTDVIMKNVSDQNGDKIIDVEFSQLGSVVLKPIIVNLGKFFDEWDIEKVNVGTGVFIEVQESQLLPDRVFEYVVFENMVVPRLEHYIDTENLNIISGSHPNDVQMSCIIEWVRLFSGYSFESIEKRIFNKYSAWILTIDEPKLDTFLQVLLDGGLQFWLDVFTKDKYKSHLERVILAVLVSQFRKEEFSKASVIEFLQKIEDLGLVSYASVIENEVCLPILAEFSQIGRKSSFEEEGFDEESFEEARTFLREWVLIFSQHGILNADELGYNCIINTISRCYRLHKARFDGYGSAPIGIVEDSINEFIQTKESDWKTLVLDSTKLKDTDRFVFWERLHEMMNDMEE